MAVEEAQLKCYEYVNAVKDIERYSGMGLYRLDAIRETAHDEICQLMGLDKATTKQCTDHLDKYNWNGTELYLALLDLPKSASEG